MSLPSLLLKGLGQIWIILIHSKCWLVNSDLCPSWLDLVGINSSAHTLFNLVVCNHLPLPLSCLLYGSKLLSCSLTTKVASKLPQCLFQATSHIRRKLVYIFIIAVTYGRVYVLVFAITEPLALKDPLSIPSTSVSSPHSSSLHLESDDQNVSFSCFSHTFVCSRSIRDFRRVGLEQQQLAL